ncbi:hypothetical protein [Nonomuraea sp. GTA35]|uniref:hypothetical protein n=1 Tax=Nonomuraea sp. GTA35 TaxID=1676746 RepID=UPI0035BF0FF6
MASTPARDLPLLTGPLIGLLPTGRVGTGPEKAPEEGAEDGAEDGADDGAGDGAEGVVAGTGGETAAWPQRSQ